MSTAGGNRVVYEGAVLTWVVPDFRRTGDFLAEKGLSG
jgi:hypothetical protein